MSQQTAAPELLKKKSARIIRWDIVSQKSYSAPDPPGSNRGIDRSVLIPGNCRWFSVHVYEGYCQNSEPCGCTEAPVKLLAKARGCFQSLEPARVCSNTDSKLPHIWISLMCFSWWHWNTLPSSLVGLFVCFGWLVLKTGFIQPSLTSASFFAENGLELLVLLLLPP